MTICIDWHQTLDADDIRAGRRLIRAFDRQVRGSVGGTLARALGGALHRIVGGYLADEVDDLADLLACPPDEILFANVAYDVSACLTGCSTLAVPAANGPLHARNLDWTFRGDLLRKHTTVFSFPSRHGDFLVVTWPGVFGVLTGMAPHRFSVSVNYVGEGRSVILAIPALAWRAINGYMPVTWAVREALETKKTFAAAVKYLSEVPLLAPVLLTVVGVNDNERVVIERDPDGADLRWPDEDDVLAVTNHRVGEDAEEEEEGEESESETRLAFLRGRLSRRPPATADSALALLSSAHLFQNGRGFRTQQQVVMEPRAGRLTVRAPGRRKEIYEGGEE